MRWVLTGYIVMYTLVAASISSRSASHRVWSVRLSAGGRTGAPGRGRHEVDGLHRCCRGFVCFARQARRNRAVGRE